MEQKKAPNADIEQRRTTGFLMGLILVLAVCYVALEWNSMPQDDGIEPLDLTDLMHETELVPMSNEETALLPEEKQQQERGEELRVVDDEVETEQAEELVEGDEGDDEVQQQVEQDEADEKALASLEVDPANPLNFHVVEDLPKFPGGAVELMKWLTRNLRYPPQARSRKVQGRVVAQFYIEKDGKVTGISIAQSLSPECDSEALRVLRMMPDWEPGIQRDQPCRTKVSIPIVFKL